MSKKFLLCLSVYFFLFSFSQSKIFYEGDRVKIQQKKKIITLEGSAFIRQEKAGLKADKIIWYQNDGVAEAFNNVTFLDRTQGVLYKGNYVKFFFDKNFVKVRKNPSIENKKKNVIIYSDAFDANTKTQKIKAIGNVRLFMNSNTPDQVQATSVNADYFSGTDLIILKKNAFLKTPNQLIHANQININQKNNILNFFGNVKIQDNQETSKKNKKKKKLSLGENIIYCDKSTFFTDKDSLKCEDNVKIINDLENTQLFSHYLYFDGEKNESIFKKKVSYIKKSATNENRLQSEYLKILQNQSIMYLSNDVVYSDIDQSGNVNLKLNCFSMHYRFPTNTEKNLECFKDVILKNEDNGSRTYSDYLFYEIDKGTGFLTQNPYYLNRQGKENLYVYSKKIDFNRNTQLVNFIDNVTIIKKKIKKEPVDQQTNSIVTCTRGEFSYSGNDIFKCIDNVDAYELGNEGHFYGDLLTYYFEKEYSILEANGMVLYNFKKSSTNTIEGTAKYVENFHNLGYSLLQEKVFVNEILDGKVINKLKTDKLKYFFLSNNNVFEGYDNVVFENIKDKSTLYSDFFYYDFDKNKGWASKQPVLVSENNDNTVEMVYADEIHFDNVKKQSDLFSNIYIFKQKTSFRTPPRQPVIPKNQNFLNCQKAYYFFKDEKKYFECVEKMHLVDRENNLEIFSDYMLYDQNLEYGLAKENPYLIRNEITNTFYVYSDSMEFYRKSKISLFHTNVIMYKKVKDKTLSSINCDESKYIFTTTNSMECFGNVKVIDNENQSVITAEYLLHQVDEEYSFVSKDAKVVFGKKGKQTIIKADVLENFEKEEIMYAKGNVFVDNGANEASSSWGLYDKSSQKFTLYGTPVVRDKKGSEFEAEEVYFDLTSNKMQLGSDVSGSFIPDNFFE